MGNRHYSVRFGLRLEYGYWPQAQRELLLEFGLVDEVRVEQTGTAARIGDGQAPRLPRTMGFG